MCAIDFHSNRSHARTCSSKCRGKLYSDNHRNKETHKTCKQCNKVFVSSGTGSSRTYCSDECRNRARYIREFNSDERIKKNLRSRLYDCVTSINKTDTATTAHKTCPRCGDDFKTKQYNKKYCSTVCQQKSWSDNNHDHILRKQKEYRKLKPDKAVSKNHRDNVKRWKENNKDTVREYSNKWNKERKQSNPDYNVACNLRSRLSKAIKNNFKTGSAVRDLGCSIEELKRHLESQFAEGMSWDNYGKWHIDHIKPLSSFNLTKAEELKKACHFSNLQPLWAKDNLKKGNKIQEVVHGKKTSIETVKRWAESLEGELISDEYVNMLKKLKWKCKHNHVFETTFNHVKNRGQWCPTCGEEKARKTFIKNNKNGEHSKKISAGHQGISVDEWKGFVAKENKKKWKKERGNYRYHNEIEYKLKLTIRYRAKRAVETIKGASNISREELLASIGCSIEELKSYLESKFQEGMTWDNWSRDGWHIDHIRPLASFDLIDPDEQKLANHYTNLQPLWAIDNLLKGANYDEKQDE